MKRPTGLEHFWALRVSGVQWAVRGPSGAQKIGGTEKAILVVYLGGGRDVA